MNKINIEPFQESDLYLVYQWNRNPRVYQFMRRDSSSLDELRETYNSYFGKDSETVYLITYDGTPIGYFMIEGIDFNNKNCEFAIVIGEDDFRNKGIGQIVIEMMLEKVFKEMSLHRVFAKINEGNIPSIRCFTKAGFVLEGRHRESRLINGEYKDLLFYSILEGEWFSK